MRNALGRQPFRINKPLQGFNVQEGILGLKKGFQKRVVLVYCIIQT